jgi:Cys-rich protein (TIGR01571 family)
MAVPCFFWVFQVRRNGGQASHPRRSHQFDEALQMGSRTDIRSHYEIRGESTDDCLASLFCHSCALTQEGRELELEEKSFSS